MMDKLKFGDPNAKLKKMIKKVGLVLKTFTLPAGHTCPAAKDCFSRADRETGKVTDGPDTVFRCFMASAEARSPSLRKLVWHNLELIKEALKRDAQAGFENALGFVVDGAGCGMPHTSQLIHKSLPKKFDIMRVHVGGDYFSREYLMAWIEVAKLNPDKVFYSYSKSLHLFKQFALPENLVLTASRGGKHDDLIDLHGWKEALVVYSEEEAAERGLEIDHDDTHAAFGEDNFALLIHGTQPAGSMASQALQAIKRKASA